MVAKVLVPTGEGWMKVVEKDSKEYRENYEKIMKDLEFKERLNEVGDFWAAKERRVRSTYSKAKANLIIGFEEFFELNFDYGAGDFYSKLFIKLKWCVNKWTEYYVRLWSNKRLSYPDFESIFWEEIWKIAEKHYDDNTTPYFIYEKIEVALKYRGLDVVRKATNTKQGKFEHSAEALPVDFENCYASNVNIEKEVTDRILVNQIMNDQNLSSEERQFIKTKYFYPDASFQELADLMGFDHREKARRLFQRIRDKLLVYRYSDDSSYDIYKYQHTSAC